jgi:DNA-directed RNA polymerase subunit RPC12/RpoP
MPDSSQDHRFPCPQCGADLRFSPGEGLLVCDHCGHTEPLTAARAPTQPIRELDLRRGLEAALPDTEMEEIRTSRCPNCGAEIEFDPAVHSTECPFCATPVVTDTGPSRHIKPRGLAPFDIRESEARAAMTAWLGSLWFAPSGLRDYARKGRALQGVYVPYWTFDADTRSTYSGQRGTIYYETRPVQVRDAQGRVRTEMRQVAKIRWTPVSGRVARFFDAAMPEQERLQTVAEFGVDYVFLGPAERAIGSPALLDDANFRPVFAQGDVTILAPQEAPKC